MSEVEIRAKTVLKLKTSQGTHINLEFVKGDHVKSMAMELVHILIQNVGVNEAKKLLDEKLGKYDKDYPGLSIHNNLKD